MKWRTVAWPKEIRLPSQVHDLQTEQTLAHGCAPRRTLHEGAIEPRAHCQDRNVSKTGKDFGIPTVNSKDLPEALQHEVEDNRYQQRPKSFQDNVHGPGQESEPEACIFDLVSCIRHAVGMRLVR